MDGTCSRCGAFAKTWEFEPKLCEACQRRLTESTRFWSDRALTGFGILLNPAVGAVLLALNFKRLGDSSRARTWTVVSAVLIAVYALVVVADVQARGLFGVNVVFGLFLSRQWAPSWKRLTEVGVQRASVWPPLLITLGVLALFVVGLVLVDEFSGGSDGMVFDPATGKPIE